MTAQIIDGKKIANSLLEELKEEITKRQQSGIRNPALAVILVGDDPASSVYVNNKRKACEKVGIKSLFYDLPATTSQTELEKLIIDLNNDKDVDGILVQSPLPHPLDEDRILDLISPNKDVDGFHPINLGLLAMRQPKFRSCTPYGVIKMLKAMQIDVLGKDAVVVGASNHVGRPMAFELLLAGATVTQCHSKTQNFSKKSTMRISLLQRLEGQKWSRALGLKRVRLSLILVLIEWVTNLLVMLNLKWLKIMPHS